MRKFLAFFIEILSNPNFRIATFKKMQLAKFAAQNSNFITLVQENRLLIDEVLRLRNYVENVLKERHWVQSALDRKEFVQTALSHQRHKEDEMGLFEVAFDRFRDISLSSGGRLSVPAEKKNPQIYDATSETAFDRHYLYHPAWAARVLFMANPARHVDISSILHFSTIVSAFIPVEFYDYRPAYVELDGFSSNQADLLNLPFENSSVHSLSCMHVIEHIGLGRYGEPLDADGDLKAIAELVRVLAPGGNLLVATPVGVPCVHFNAHRVYDAKVFVEYFTPLELVEFALIPEHGPKGYVINPEFGLADTEVYACGCFWFRKRLDEGMPAH